MPLQASPSPVPPPSAPCAPPACLLLQVQHPGVRRMMEGDLSNLRRLMELLDDRGIDLGFDMASEGRAGLGGRPREGRGGGELASSALPMPNRVRTPH